MKRRVMYVELKSGFGDSGPASIGWVNFSKTGRTVYYRGRELRRVRGGGISGNHVDVETDDEYWVSGVKKNGEDRHWAGVGGVEIDEDALNEYRRIIGE
jgi:hypothetical protein